MRVHGRFDGEDHEHHYRFGDTEAVEGVCLCCQQEESFQPFYGQAISSFKSWQIYDQTDAAGFIQLYGLPVRVRATLEKRGN